MMEVNKRYTVKNTKKKQKLIPTSFIFKKRPLKILLKSAIRIRKSESAKILRIRKSVENSTFLKRIFVRIRIRPKNSTDCHPPKKYKVQIYLAEGWFYAILFE